MLSLICKWFLGIVDNAAVLHFPKHDKICQILQKIAGIFPRTLVIVRMLVAVASKMWLKLSFLFISKSYCHGDRIQNKIQELNLLWWVEHRF